MHPTRHKQFIRIKVKKNNNDNNHNNNNKMLSEKELHITLY